MPLQQIVTSDLRSFSHISPLLLVSSSLICHYTLNLSLHVIFEGPALQILSLRSLTTTTRIMKRSVVGNILRIFIRSGRPGRHKGQMTEKTRRRNPGHPSMTVTLKTQGRTFGHPMMPSYRHLKEGPRTPNYEIGSQTLLNYSNPQNSRHRVFLFTGPAENILSTKRSMASSGKFKISYVNVRINV